MKNWTNPLADRNEKCDIYIGKTNSMEGDHSQKKIFGLFLKLTLALNA